MEPTKSSLNNPDEFQGNSNRSREENKKLPDKPVLSGSPEVKSENPFVTFYKAVFPGTLANVKKSLWNRAVRAVQDTLYNAIVGFLDDYIYDGRGRTQSNSSVQRSSLTNPDKYWHNGNSPALAPGYPFKTVVYRTRADAESVLQAMIGYLTDYRKVPVAFYLDYSQQSTESTDNDWGWRSLDGVVAKPEGNGYILTLPAPQPL